MSKNRLSMVYDVLAIDRASAVFKKVATSINESSTAMKMLTTAAGALSFGVVARQAYSFVEAASDLNEATSLTGRVFNSAKEEMVDFAEGGARAFGLSKTATLNAVNEIGNTLMNLGYDMNEAGDATKNLIQLAGDMASAFNKDVSQALYALQAGLRGENEPLRQFGVFLDEAAVKAAALEKGLYDGTGQMDRNARAVGALSVIMDDTKTIQGDFAMTSEGLANSQRILAADIENLKVSMGEGLLPVVEGGVHLLDKMVVAAQGVPGPVKTGAVSFTLMTSAAIALAPAIVSVKTAMEAQNLTMGTVLTKSAKVTLAIMALAAAYQTLKSNADFDDLKNSMTEAVTGGDELRRNVEALQAEFENLQDAEDVGKSWWDKYGFGDIDLADAAGDITTQFTRISETSEATGEKLEQGKERLRLWNSEVSQAAAIAGLSVAEFESLEGVAAGVNMVMADGITPTAQMGDYLQGLATAAKEAREGEAETTEETESLAFQFSQAADEGTNLLDVMNQLSGGARSLAEAEEAQLTAFDAAKEEMKDGKKVLGDLTKMTAAQREEVIANRDALRGVRDATIERIDALMEEGRRTGDAATAEKEANAVRQEAIDKIGEMTGLTGEQLDAVIDLIGGLDAIPDETWAFVGVDSAKAEARVATMKAELEALRKGKWVVNLSVKAPTGRFKITNPDGSVSFYNYGQFAGGGLVTGPGGPRDDKIPAWLSNGEFIMQASAVDRIGVDVLHALNKGLPMTPRPRPSASLPSVARSQVEAQPIVLMVDGKVLHEVLVARQQRIGRPLGLESGALR